MNRVEATAVDDIVSVFFLLKAISFPQE